MLGPSPVLIDFARSTIGPVAVDAAKFVSDVIARQPVLRDGIPKWNDGGTAMSALKPIAEVFNLDENDATLFSSLLHLNLCALMTYADVPNDTKAWIKSQLAS
jgi:hypothetical protein